MSIQLRGGATTTDRRLDRLPHRDARNADYPIRTLVDGKAPRSYTWSCTAYLDQGSEGACVGHAWAHEVAARPAVRPVDSTLAFGIYRRAQQLDPWPGEDYSGTSVLAGAKATVERGFIREYRWAFSWDDFVLALGYAGPVVLGINWYTGMFDTDDRGFIAPTGRVAGGHAILATGVSVRNQTVRLHNSWGREWGVRGDALIAWPDLERLLNEDGEACVPMVRV